MEDLIIVAARARLGVYIRVMGEARMAEVRMVMDIRNINRIREVAVVEALAAHLIAIKG